MDLHICSRVINLETQPKPMHMHLHGPKNGNYSTYSILYTESLEMPLKPSQNLLIQYLLREEREKERKRKKEVGEGGRKKGRDREEGSGAGGEGGGRERERKGYCPFHSLSDLHLHPLNSSYSFSL